MGLPVLVFPHDEFQLFFVQVLLRAHANMREERQRVEITSLLSDLFDQISGSKR